MHVCSTNKYISNITSEERPLRRDNGSRDYKVPCCAHVKTVLLCIFLLLCGRYNARRDILFNNNYYFGIMVSWGRWFASPHLHAPRWNINRNIEFVFLFPFAFSGTYIISTVLNDCNAILGPRDSRGILCYWSALGDCKRTKPNRNASKSLWLSLSTTTKQFGVPGAKRWLRKHRRPWVPSTAFHLLSTARMPTHIEELGLLKPAGRKTMNVFARSHLVAQFKYPSTDTNSPKVPSCYFKYPSLAQV